LTEFENTASFSRNYQAAQDCMCDTEHMFDCSMESSVRALSRDDQRLDQMINKFKVRSRCDARDRKYSQSRCFSFQIENDHKGLVAKKGAVKRDNGNPFLVGEKLPIAAKKGFDFGF
jgi:hypothetical protein